MTDARWTLDQIAHWVSATTVGPGETAVNSVSTDSRSTQPGDLFVALVGDHFDGHRFIKQAIGNGAVAAVVDPSVSGTLSCSHLVVPDTLHALQSFAAAHRDQFGGAVAAVTGSAGKTTTRRIIAAMLATLGETLQPEKNYNNHIGVPLTLLRIEARHRFVVLELGCSDFGEIAALTRLGQPTIAAVTNVGRAHLEKLGDLKGVSRAKGELFDTMSPAAIAVVNLDDPWVSEMPVGTRSTITFGTDRRADVRLKKWQQIDYHQDIQLQIDGKTVDLTCPLLGEHNARNTACAAAVAFGMGVAVENIGDAVSQLSAEPGRQTIVRGKNGVMLIDDTYNANPDSMHAALTVLTTLASPNRRVAVLGEMCELGTESVPAHLKLGTEVAGRTVDVLVAVGEHARPIADGAVSAGMASGSVWWTSNLVETLEVLNRHLAVGDLVLLKGSRSMKLDQIVASLRDEEG